MNFLILSFFFISLATYGQCFPSNFHLKLTNICPNSTFNFKRSEQNFIVNSYYLVDYSFDFENQTSMEMPLVDFQKYYINSGKLINRLRNVYNEELADLYGDSYIKNANFMKRNLTIKLKYFDEIKQSLEFFRIELKNNKNGLDQLNNYIRIVKRTGNLIRLLARIQDDYTSNDFFDSSKFDNSFFLETNDKTELPVFDSRELMENIEKLSIYKFDRIEIDYNQSYHIWCKFYVPFQNNYHDEYRCTDKKDLPIFYRSKGRDYLRFNKVDSTSFWF